MIDLGFGLWSEESSIYLFPLWLFPFISDDIKTVDISGNSLILKKEDMDNDQRFGCVAYGIVPVK